MGSPLVTVVVAAYGRSHLLPYSVGSALRQTVSDLEVLVVDDCSPDDTQAAVDDLGDARTRYVRTGRNHGEQSLPNNIGVGLAAGRLIAFLNQDDLWFPDHLERLLALRERTGSRLVHSASVMRWIEPHGERLMRRAERRRFHPLDDVAASTWLLDRDLHLELQGWRPASQCYGPSSQEFLFRAWRAGAGVHGTGTVSVLAEGSGNITDSYLARAVSWHEDLAAALRSDPTGLRTRCDAAPTLVRPPRSLRRKVRHRVSRAAALGLARTGRPPMERYFRLRTEHQGAYLTSLRETRGLDRAEPRDAGRGPIDPL